MFTRVALPTPFPVEAVNAYVAGRTVIDPGPATDAARKGIRNALADEDLAFEDVARVLITHPHPDHFGQARRFSEAGAEIVASAPAAAVVEDFAARLEYERTFFRDFFERCGTTPDEAAVIARLAEALLPHADDVAVDRTVTTGDEVVVDGQALAVTETTGHASGELLFTAADADGTFTVVGDHVLPTQTPTPFLQPPPEPGGRRPRVLPAFNDSLERLAAESIDRLLPGHGAPIDAPAARIEAVLDSHESRTRRVQDLLDGPTTPVAVADALFPDLPATDRFAGLSEAVGHLDVLEDRGLVRRTDRNGTLRYAPVSE